MDEENLLNSVAGNAANRRSVERLQGVTYNKRLGNRAATTHQVTSNRYANNNPQTQQRSVPHGQNNPLRENWSRYANNNAQTQDRSVPHRQNKPPRENWRRPRTADPTNRNLIGNLQTDNPNTRQDRYHGAGSRGAQLYQSNSDASADQERQVNRNSARNRRHNFENRDENINEPNQQTNQHSGKKIMGFKALEEISLSDPRDILEKISKRKNDFLDRISNIERNNHDIYVLVVEILSKVCQSSFDELKQRLLLDVIKSQFLKNLRSYLMDLPYTENRDKIRNRHYWNNQNGFWQNFITFSECIFNIVPSVALQNCRPILNLCKLCLEELKTRHEFTLSEENQTKFTELRERMTTFEQKKEQEEKVQRNKRNAGDTSEESEPPESFRELSVVPTRDDLLGQRPYLRANLVRGGYRDTEHYLDVQFRLLREDCFGPLRDGLLQYIDNPNLQKYDNIRVYRNVRFVGPYVSKNHIGVTVQLDDNTVKRLKKINWAHSKRFIFGSLLLFTNDDCRSFITATIIDRDVKYLVEGRIPINIVQNADASLSEQFKSNAMYVMIESEVYFEPYQHVLKALQDPRFPAHLAMSKYIVNVQPETTPPAYITNSTSYTVKTGDIERSFYVMQPWTWPSREDLGLNDSQYEAYRLALTHEFAVIQGPPGTGKTYLGVKVAETLLKNWKSQNTCAMLVICYTNHALDQFLEHILQITDSIVRIGGQSRNPAMEAISLNQLRRSRNPKRNDPALNLFQTERHNLRMIMGQLQTAQTRIQSLRDGVLCYESIEEYIPEVQILEQYYSTEGGDIMRKWLFEHMPFVDVDRNMLEKNETDEESVPLDSDDEAEELIRTATILDDLWDNEEIDINGIEIKTSFLLNDAEQKLNRLISYYKRTDSKREKQNLDIEMRDLNSRVRFFKEKVNSAVTTYEEARMNLDLKLIHGKRVVGLTTSGAARLRKLLQALAPPIVIVEEAAEVLEQHIITALTASCQHLILIGDHQQLRPSAAYMRLARHYNIEVSLFERMVLNGMHSRRLGVQHRMRPEIAALIAPHIYRDLTNHPSVNAFPHVRGVTTDLFFFTHNYKEEMVEDSASRSNHKEADMTLGLANYIMQQGYEPEDVTILAAYTGQMFYMKKQRPKYAFLDKVKITVVDNYQGEESKIILLSLVRNNAQDRIGFLGTENRICVALSRAKHGFYIFGNIKTLKANSPLWTNIATTLENQGSIGAELRLKCENHQNQFTAIMSPKDFEKVPEGGCLLKCNYNLPACGHRCPRICHGYDRGHSEAICQMKCERVICELGHVCPLKCALNCQPCMQLVPKTLPCGHTKQVKCYMDPNHPNIKCTVVLTVNLPDCGHEAKKPCHLDLKKVVCMVPCVYRVDSCGHQCRLRCHVNDDPDHEKYECLKPCAKAKNGCTANLLGDRGDHQCPNYCYEPCADCNVEIIKKRSKCRHSDRVQCCQDVDATPCRKKCARTMECGHFCKKLCFEPCGDCTQKVKKVIPTCKHTIDLPCKEEAMQEMCQKPCERKLPCGHNCTKRCGEKCDQKDCLEIINMQLQSPCGHRVKLPCNVFSQSLGGSIDSELLMSHCTEPCNMTLKCGHVCPGTCARCHQGRLHAPCTQPCHVTLICGHQCEEPCNQLCPPCKKPCEVKCDHTQCKKSCGAPCVPCQEQCPRACVHGRCNRRCGEPCSREACDEACTRRLPCGHVCRGLCGEPCPDICRECRPDQFPKDFLGYDFDDDAKFVKLQDCSHLLEVEDADNLMKGDMETVMIRSCPFCRKPIINTQRYKDYVNEMYKKEINPIKEKVYGTATQVNEQAHKLSEAIKDLNENHAEVIKENTYFASAFAKLKQVLTSKKKISMLQLNMNFVYLEILDKVANYHKKFKSSCLTELKEEFLDQTKLICTVLKNNVQKISQQQQEDIGNEIKRMNSIIQLSKIFGHTTYKTSRQHPKVANAAKEAKAVVIGFTLYDEDKTVIALKTLEETVKLNGIVSKEERALIVKAMGFKQGHWFKCPNGHFYCIGECGGAMQISKCNECGAAIGGTSHTLLGNNSHAKEMDGSRFPAWSNEYNDMRNWEM